MNAGSSDDLTGGSISMDTGLGSASSSGSFTLRSSDAGTDGVSGRHFFEDW